MSTVLDVLNAAALNIGAVQSGEALSSQEASDILSTWNRLIDSTSLQSEAIYTTRIDTISLPATTQVLTFGTDPNTSAVGTGGSVRPDRITAINLVMSSGNTPVYLPMFPLDVKDWAEISVQQIYGPPSKYYADGASPLASVYFYLIPDKDYQVQMYSWQALSNQVGLTDTVVFPRGYERFWVTRLAIEIAPMFGLTPSPVLVENARQAEQNVKSLNSRSPRMKTDPMLRRSGKGLFNWLSREIS